MSTTGATQALAARQAYLSGAGSMQECVAVSLARISQTQAWHSLAYYAPEQLRSQALAMDQCRHPEQSGPLAGVTVVVKDNIHVAGWPLSAVSPALNGYTPEQDAPVIEALTQAGAMVLAKTNMHELGLGVTGADAHASLGPVANAHDPQRIAGGSSSGTAVALALGIAHLGLGTDTGGSIRIPAAYNGLAGLRPTHGSLDAASPYSLLACVPIAPSIDVLGPMACSVQDLAFLDSSLRGQSFPDALPLAGLRLGLPDSLWAGLEPQVQQVAEQACQRLRHNGVQLLPISVSALLAQARDFLFHICMQEAASALGQYLQTAGQLSWDTLIAGVASAHLREVLTDYIVPAAHQPTHKLDTLLQWQAALRVALDQKMSEAGVTALLYPSVALMPATLQQVHKEAMAGHKEQADWRFSQMTRNAALAAASGFPALTLPGPRATGLPVGLEFCARPGQDRRLLALGLQVEQLW